MGNIKTIPDFKVQLAMEVPIEKVKLPCIGQLKYNGTRCIALHTTNGIQFITRNGKVFTYPRLASELEINIPYGFMLDGELCFGDSQNEDHTKVSGIVNSSIHGNPIADSHGIVYNVFDIMTLDEFHCGIANRKYKDRFELLKEVIVAITPNVRIAETWEFTSHTDINDKFAELLASGYEGLILKHWDHKYSFKRSKDWIKVKAVKTADVSCWSITPGTGKYEGMIGSLDCQGIVEGQQVCVSVGSGLTDAHRAMNEDNFIGKTIEVKYNTLIQNKVDNNWSLFLPRFVGVRIDK